MPAISVAFVIVTFTIFHRGLCHSSGAPDSKCESMTPNHGSLPQTGESPYKIKVMKSYYVRGENVKVSIESSNDDIKGYLIQARQVGGSEAIGTFVTPPVNGQYVNCGNSKGAITHTNKLAVKTIDFEWVPPSGLSGNVLFYATVVKDISTFWVKLQSPELYRKEMQPTSTQLPSTTAKENVPETSQSMPTTHTEKMSASASMIKGGPTTMSMMTGNSTSNSMTNSTSAPTLTARGTCKPSDPDCNGAESNHYNFLVLSLIGFIQIFWQM